jgi:hypothetical protein
MARVRYRGDDEARNLALPGGFIRFDRMQWVDVEAAAADAGIGAHHVPVVLAGLGDDFEIEQPKSKKGGDA